MAKKIKTPYNRSTFLDKVEGYIFSTIYHTKGSKKKHKSPWSINDADAHEVFRSAYIHEVCQCKEGLIGEESDLDYMWMNDNVKGLCSLRTTKNEKNGWLQLQEIGKNGERLAYFPNIENTTDTWHGYPVSSEKIGNRLAKYWLKKGIISLKDYKSIYRNEI